MPPAPTERSISCEFRTVTLAVEVKTDEHSWLCQCLQTDRTLDNIPHHRWCTTLRRHYQIYDIKLLCFALGAVEFALF